MIIPVVESSQTADARRVAARLAAQLGFSETEAGKVAIVATELASNLHKHGGGGEIYVSALRPPHRGLEILALDRGRGLGNLADAFRDGFSTAGSPGTGLGAVRRLSNCFDVYSHPDHGTALLASFRIEGQRPEVPLNLGGISVARSGESVCGDDWDVHYSGARASILLCDGLGHGPAAAEAAATAVRAFHTKAGSPLPSVMEAVHLAMRPTRGGTVAIADLDFQRTTLYYVGVGNLAGAILSAGKARHLVSHNGTAGHTAVRIQEFSYEFPINAMLIMHSDGLATQWSLDRYPGLAERSPTLIAGVLYRDFARGRDDVTVVVARHKPWAFPSSLLH